MLRLLLILAIAVPIAAQQPQPSAPPIGGVYVVGKGVAPPQAVYDPSPSYSEQARQANYQGTVILWLIVDTDGVPRDIKVTHSLGMGLDEAATDAVRRWRFKPATKDGKPVAVQINVQVNFRLYDGPGGLCTRIFKHVKEKQLDEIKARVEAGDANSMLQLACGCWLGELRPPDEFSTYAEKAAALGSPGGAFLLGEANRYGIRRERNMATAFMWYRVARLGGVKEAEGPLQQLTKLTTPEQRAEAEARVQEWMAKHPLAAKK